MERAAQALLLRTRLAFMALCALGPGLRALPALAQQTMPAPSAFVACLKLPDGAKLEFPQGALERRDSGTAQVELVFSSADEAPKVRVLNWRVLAEALVDATTLHVQRFRMPCLPAGHAPVTLRQDYVFIPNDGRKVVATTPTDSDPARQEPLACMTVKGDRSPPHYPMRSLEREEQGNVLLTLTFEKPDAPPRVDVVARPRSTGLTNSVLEYVERLRLPCLGSAPARMSLAYNFRITDSRRVVISDVGLVSFLREARNVPKGVYFDLNTMACPFELRVTYWRPHWANTLGQLDRDVPARRPFLDWLAKIELDIGNAETANLLLGSEFTLRVPCGVVDL